MMQLRDTVQVLAAGEVYDPYSGETAYSWTSPTVEATIPAYVGYSSTALIVADARAEIRSELRAVIEPYPLDPARHRIRWQGDDYTIDGNPMLRMRGAAQHHLTVPLTLVEG